MGADTVRLLLFLAGIALILGIYFWDRAKKQRLKTHATRKPRREPPVSLDEEVTAGTKAHTGDALWDGLERTRDDGLEETALYDALEELDGLVRDEVAVTGAAAPGEESELLFAGEEANDLPDQGAGLPQKILQLNIVTRSGSMPGGAIARSVREAGMEEGDLQIYHRYDDEGKRAVLFSLASLVEPGTFPLQEMDGFSTPGIILFSQLPGPRDAMEIFEQMLKTAEYLSVQLGGELQDSSHSDLSHQTTEHIREEIIEYKRQLRLARISHQASR
jgi:cell division protein ZipA